MTPFTGFDCIYE